MEESNARKPSQQPRRVRSAPARYAVEELKFLKSPEAIRNFIGKIKIVFPRFTGLFDRFYRVPPVLQIEPTNRCNVDCICCPTSRSSRRRGYMDFDLFRRIIDEASEIGVKAIFLFLHGEPMLHPQIVEMIRYIKSKRLAYHMTTNGIPFNVTKIRGILSSGTDNADHISFSMMGATKQVHEKIVRKANYDDVVKNLKMLVDMREEMRVNGPVIEAIFYAMPENKHEEGKFLRKWQGTIDHVRMSGDISQSFSEYKRNDSHLTTRTKTCLNLWQKMTIFWNGDVTLCCQDVDGDYVLGNLKEETINEIWSSSTLLTIKTLHKKKQFDKIPLCHRCDM